MGGAAPPAGTDDRAGRLRAQWGAAIKETRELRGMSRKEFAAALGVTVQAVGYWETGTSAPRPHLQIDIAQVLGVPWGVLFQPGVA